MHEEPEKKVFFRIKLSKIKVNTMSKHNKKLMKALSLVTRLTIF